MHLADLKIERCGLGLNLRSLKTAKASPKLSKNHIAQLSEITDELALLLEERADIVHGQLCVVELDRKQVAIFRNPQHLKIGHSEIARIVSLERFAQVTARANGLATKLRTLGQPAKPKEKAPQQGGAPTVIPIRQEAQ